MLWLHKCEPGKVCLSPLPTPVIKQLRGPGAFEEINSFDVADN